MSAWVLAGWLGNACFFGRFALQWAASERLGRSAAPTSFWWISLAGSLLLGLYSHHREEPILLVGTLVNAAIYARNLALSGKRPGPLPRPLAIAGGAAAALLLLSLAGLQGVRETRGAPFAWLACAFAGQLLWSSRFVAQWWCAERRGRSHFPRAFWWISLSGNLLLLAYALSLRDAVYVAGFLPGPLVQGRNLWLEHRSRTEREAPRVSVGAAGGRAA